MSINQMTSLLVTVTVFEMMVAVGLGLKLAQLTPVAREWRLLARAALANYVLAPALVLGLSLLFHAQSLITIGLLLFAACPGGPYGPPFTAMAKGNVPIAVGLSVLLAGSSPFVAPLLLRYLVPLMTGGAVVKEIDVLYVIGTLLLTILIPLIIGMVVRARRPELADRLKTPATRLSVVLNLLMVVSITVVQFHLLASIGVSGFAVMVLLAIANLVVGWLMGGPGSNSRTTMAFTTAARNTGTGLVIATASFPGTAALAAALAFALVQTVAVALLALGWRRWLPPASEVPGARA